jgi:hypothetical protein
MRCRHCGKELALLKRLRGGGEFCSEAHRQSFQDEYNQLALSRLMQAKPASQAAEPVAPAPQAEPVAIPRTPAAVLVAEPPKSMPAVQAKQDESAPAELAGFLFEVPDAMMTETPYASQIEVEFIAAMSPALPGRGSVAGSSSTVWVPSAQVNYAPAIEARNYPTPLSEHGLEAREFGRMAAVVEIGLGTDTEGVPDAVVGPLEVQLRSFPPQGPGIPWVSLPYEFAPLFVELDGFAKLDFVPLGAPAHESVPAAAEPENVESEHLALDPAELLMEEPEPELAEPVQIETVAVEPVRIEAAFLESVSQLAPKGTVVRPSTPALAQTEAPVAESPVPDVVTQSLPVTLHGIPAARGKVTSVITSALTPDVEVQLPPSVALPLRPTMVFGPAPTAAVPTPEPKAKPKFEFKPQPKSEPKLEIKPEPKVEPKPQIIAEIKAEPKVEPKREIRPQSRPTNGKNKKAVAPVPVVEPPAPPAPVQEIPRAVEVPRVVEQPALTATSFDLGLPSLDVQTSPWARLSMGAKIGAAAAVVVAISGVGYLVSGGHSTPAVPAKPARQEMIVAPGLPVPDAGWIADWSPDAAHGRRISMLRGSLPLTDLRVEFQAQIESKALGWVFRGMNPKNFYVTKLEVIKPGLEPTVALVHFAVIDGREQNRVQVPLPMPVRVDTTYKIRFEAVGSRFTTWVQDQKIDEWSDTRIGSGGAGLYAERGESSQLQGVFNVMQLVAKN